MTHINRLKRRRSTQLRILGNLSINEKVSERVAAIKLLMNATYDEDERIKCQFLNV